MRFAARLRDRPPLWPWQVWKNRFVRQVLSRGFVGLGPHLLRRRLTIRDVSHKIVGMTCSYASAGHLVDFRVLGSCYSLAISISEKGQGHVKAWQCRLSSGCRAIRRVSEVSWTNSGGFILAALRSRPISTTTPVSSMCLPSQPPIALSSAKFCESGKQDTLTRFECA
ncbi:hypothetical protein BDY17DRAFT_145307 [Neohortaea acidophila]|uniref:Uncharacterized protein n=1 Tax=Neohortaea acidophila TaxID=245834 RepID=A0A6A6PT85_9PEZI|nr:uncharacterized protein BDY17DRAFT_145307 [Neohortaea acidophila]KAF2483318.1 hypothetical protein BDY17DRAFT_145307 [Neohortaea acidophila]